MNKVILASVFLAANLGMMPSHAVTASALISGETTCQYYAGPNRSGASIKKSTKSIAKGNFGGKANDNIGSHSVQVRGKVGTKTTFGRSIVHNDKNQAGKKTNITVSVANTGLRKVAKNLGSDQRSKASSFTCLHNRKQ